MTNKRLETKKDNLVFISWAPHCSRSDSIARRLGGSSYMVYSPFWGSRYTTIAFKYLVQTFKTLKILIRERPKVVVVMTPPIIACVPVWLYTKVTSAVYVIDTHTAAFVHPRWRPFIFLHRFFSRDATVTIVTNQYLRSIVEAWGARAKIVSHVPVCFSDPFPVVVKGRCNMTLVSSFTWDEPVPLFIEAARRIPEIQFYITGSLEDVDPSLVRDRPINVEFTGFLPSARYVGLLQASDAIISLTTLDHTMQRAGYEAIYLGKPVITSNFDILRDEFHIGAVHVDNNIDDIVKGIMEMSRNIERYRVEARELKAEKLEAWKMIEAELRDLLFVST